MKNKPSKLVRDAYKALKIAVARALADHQRLGHSVYVWEGGKVVRVPAQIPPARKLHHHRKAA
jgi:hypothetical protein